MDLNVSLPDDIYAAIGRIANAWAKIELSADLMNTVIYVRHDARSYEKRIPVALEAKLRFLRRAMNRIPALSPYRAGSLAFVKDALDMRRARHAMIHGVARHHGPEGTTFVHLTNLTDNMGFGEMTYPDKNIHAFALLSEELGVRAFAACKHLINDWIDESQKTLGELPRSKHRVFLPRLQLFFERLSKRLSRLFS